MNNESKTEELIADLKLLLSKRDEEILELKTEKAELDKRLDALEEKINSVPQGTGIFIGGVQEYYREYISENMKKQKDRGDEHGR